MSILSRGGVRPRDKPKEVDIEKILVFGYQCKLFRDDEKALEMDRGSQLIPWMGDASLQIDRYILFS